MKKKLAGRERDTVLAGKLWFGW